MRLTFQNGKFLLDSFAVIPECVDAEEWKRGNFGRYSSYVTTDIKAAARFRQYADDEAEKILNRAFVKRYSAPSAPLPPFLDEHQKEGVTWVLTRSRSYLAHVAGAGKTAEAIVAAALTPGTGQAVFIVPPNLTVNWAREVEKFFDLLVHSTAKALRKARGRDWSLAWPSLAIIPDSAKQQFSGWGADFLIVPDSMLTRAWVLGRLIKLHIRLIAVDEASRFKEPTAQRSIALFGGTLKGGRTSPGLVQRARHAVLMDGSPMPNRSMELWAPTYAMCPEAIDFMSQQDFGFRYCGAKIGDYGRWEFKGDRNQEELKRRLQKDFMHVVTEERLNHPERRRSMLFMSKDVRTAKHQSWEQKNLSRFSFSDIDEDMSQGDIATYRRELGLRKMPWVADYVSQRLEDKAEFILLFAWHRDVCMGLEKLLQKHRPGLIIGGTDKDYREKFFDLFQRGKTHLLILNILAGGRGHNLQRGGRAVFAEWSWNDETNKQCEARIARRGNDNAFMRSDYVVCPNSMDEPILNAVFKKAASVKRVIG